MRLSHLTASLAVLLSLLYNAQSSPCLQLCESCQSNTCLTCYQDWTIDAPRVTSSECGCPQGYYFNATSRICNFCPVQCTSCSNYTSCTQCLDGYRLASNGSCLANFTNSTLQFGLDLTNNTLAQANANGFLCVGCAATQSISNYFSYCTGMVHQPIMGKYAFDYDTVVYRTYYALPYHQWAQLKFQFVAIDQWLNQFFIVEVEAGRNQNPTTFNSVASSQQFSYDERIRNADFCGQPQFKDNLGLYNRSFMHTDSLLKFRVRTSLSDLPLDQQPPNFESIYFGLREVLLILGVCPPNCLTCISRSQCSTCAQIYSLDSTFRCVCNTSVAYLTSQGLCVKFCRAGVEIFVNEMCKPCNEVFPGCVECITINGAYQCGRCSNVRFLYQGTCQTRCPTRFYEMFTVVLSSIVIESCATCPSNCLECERNQYLTAFATNTSLQIICLSCKPNYVWYRGSCLSSCPTGTYMNLEGTLCSICPTGCSTCTSGVNCLTCVTSSSASAVNYIYSNGMCVLACSNTNISYNPALGCSITVCAANCLTCFGSSTSQCSSCASAYYLQNNNCVSQCSAGFYRESPVSFVCLPCPSSCKQCTQLSCSSCTLGFWLFSGQCIRACPHTYYPATRNGQYVCARCDDPYCNICTQLPATLAAIRNNTLSQCEQCRSGLYLDINTAQCVTTLPSCPANSYYSTTLQNCVACPMYCLKCQQSLCLACESSKVLDNGACVNSCPTTKSPIIDYSQIVSNATGNFTIAFVKCIWVDPLCEVYVNGNCQECRHLNPSLVLTPVANSSNSCQFSCPDGYTRSSSIVEACTITCSTNCLECDPQRICLKCGSGFLLLAGSCVANCPTGYFSDSLQCIRCDANCNQCQQDGKCIECWAGLVVSSSGNCISPTCTVSQSSAGSCTSCTSPCLTCTSSASVCTSCISSYFLVSSNSTCTRNCPNGQFADTGSASCRPCRPTCKTCTSFQGCVTCWADYYLFAASASTAYCISECPPGTFIDVIASPPRCTTCQFPCRSCFGPNLYQCIECVSGYLLDYTTCLQQCPVGKFADEYGHCDKCHYTCKECFGPAEFQCRTCHHNDEDEDDGYEYEGRCYNSSCPNATYYDQDQECKACSSNCRSCNSSVQCSLCQSGSALLNGSCVNNCPPSTYYFEISGSGSCRQCWSQFGSTCEQCNSVGCVKCALPYYRFNGSCSSGCPVGTYAADHNLRQCLPCPANCYNCTAPNLCLSCRGNFRMVNNVCTRRCISGYYYNSVSKSCQVCPVSNCAGCDSLSCSYCTSGYVLIGQQCVPVAPGGCPSAYFMSTTSQQCQNCHVSCLSCLGASTNCSSCAVGLRLINSMCVSNATPSSCVSNCAICATSTSCAVCSLPYLLLASTGACTSSCPVQYFAYLRECIRCAEGCLSCSSSALDCTGCKSGFYQLGRTCLRQCPLAYFSVGSTCQPCSGALANCVQCDNSLNCTQCQAGFSVFAATGKCIPSSKCPLRYLYSMDSSSCVSCPAHCLQCLNELSCLTCQAGYSELNAVCISFLCPAGFFQQNVEFAVPSAYLEAGTRYVSSRCIECTPPCYECVGAQICVSCLPGYNLLNSSCVIDCGVLYYTSNSSTCLPCSNQCLSCRTSSTTCTSCRGGFYLSGTQCVSECPIATFASSSNSLCQPCGPYCTQCVNSISCQICIEGLWLLGGSCLFQCPAGYAGSLVLVTSGLYNRMAQMCTACEAPCSTCLRTSSQYECTSCLAGFYLYSSRCLTTCPLGYFANPATLTCARCPSWCSNCTSFEACQSCTYPGCSLPCQLTSPATCATCETSCRYCDKSATVLVLSVRMGTCLECYSPYHLTSANRCTLSCPIGTYLDSTLNLCVICPASCSQCSDGLTCLACGNSTYIYNGGCYAACPNGTIANSSTVGGTTVLTCSINTCSGSPTSQTNCTSCVTPFYLYNQQCVQFCPNGTYQSSSSNLCYSCAAQCLNCSSFSNCSVCRSGYSLTSRADGSWSCALQCPTGTYLNPSAWPTLCVDCVTSMAGCTICIDNDTCVSCLPGMYLYRNAISNASTCLVQCPDGFYADSRSVCQACLEPSCRRCALSSMGEYRCLECQPASYYIPSASVCLPQCPIGYFSSGSLCTPCPALCASCASANCTRCSIGSALDFASGQCVSSCPVSTFRETNTTSGLDVCTACNSTAGCFDCITRNICVACLSNWLLYNGSCLTTCPTGYYASASVCVKCSSVCLECLSASNCIRCLPGFNLSSSQTCIPICSSMTTYFQSSTQTCEPCSSQCYGCTGPRFDQCLSCNVPLLLAFSTCVFNCPAGFMATSEMCLPCDQSCSTCTGSGTAAQCTRCPTGSYLYATVVPPTQGRCVRFCPSGTYANPVSSLCMTCSQLPRCGECEYNATAQQAQCRACSNGSLQVIVNNVLQCQPSTFVCPVDQMYVNSISQCVQCVVPCLRCSQPANITVCLSCSVGYLWKDGVCISSCPAQSAATSLAQVIYAGFTLSNVQTCVQCPSNCLQCVATGNITQCVTCSPQFVLNQGGCIQSCGASLTLSFNPNTLQWECLNTTITPSTCSSRGLYLLANQSGCIDVCPAGSYTAQPTWTCNLCASGCLTCADASSCLTCQSGFSMFNSQCVSSCPNQYVAVSAVCYPCSSPCSSCTGLTTKCSSCITGFFLFQQQCLQTCPAGYYSSVAANSCVACAPKCLTCTNSSQCTTCANSQYSAPACTDSSNICQPGYYILSGTTCANCSSVCTSCFGPADYQCLTCAGSLVMMDGACLPSCISGFYSFSNPATGHVECAPCSAAIANCLICSSISACVQCVSPYLLSPDSARCVQSCSQLNNVSRIYSNSLSNMLQCALCAQGCAACVLQACTSCEPGLLLSNGQCASGCPTATYQYNSSLCLPCSANCLICSSSQTCVSCNGSNYLLNGQCVSSCPQGYTVSLTPNLTCSLCSLQVAHCTSCSQTLPALACYSCETSYVLVNNTCQCAAGFYQVASTLGCQPCPSNCLTCTISQCSQCLPGRYLLNGACVTACPAPMYPNGVQQCQYCTTTNCASCRMGATVEECLVCLTGYNLLSNANGTRMCVQTCPTGTGVSQQVCQPCLTLHCQTCPTISICNDCQANYFLNSDGTCVSQCPQGTDGVISPGVDVCSPCKAGCLICSNQTNTCVQCLTGLVPLGDGSCSYNSSNRSCASGQFISQLNPLVCSACHVSCVECLGSLSSQCLSCNQPAYSMVSGTCVSVCTSIQFYNSNIQQCASCITPCITCVNSTYCSSCIAGLHYFNGACTPNCPSGYFSVNSVCHLCPQLCVTCQSDAHCSSCASSATIFYNNICYTSCPTGTYLVASTSGLASCTQCPIQCLSCLSVNQCLSCAPGYFLHGQQCLAVCPTGNYGDTGSNRCASCDTNCTSCTSSSNCNSCIQPYVLHNGACLSACPSAYYAASNECQSCSPGCLVCAGPSWCQVCQSAYLLLPGYGDSSMSCTQSCPAGFVQLNNSGVLSCESSNCTNCANCPLGQCDTCQNSWFLQSSACTQTCQIGTYPNISNWRCTGCMDNCLVCPNATYCQQCSDGYNFSLSLDNKCVSEAVFTYGVMANISGFTSNITEITSLVYLSTSAGPVFFGEMSSTYFNIEFCQFMFFHDGIAGSNSEMKTFLQSLSKMSMSSLGSTDSQSARRMLLATESLSFLQINVPIFIMMGCFLALYAATYLIQKHIDSMCLSCSKLNFYVKEICIYLGNRFKWIYFDFVVWLSYLPFLYFSIVQVQKFNFKSGLQGFSSIFSILVLLAYPLYPVLIAYNIKKNYVALCMENDKMVEMSLSPWVYKVKRPQFIPAQGEPFIYCSKANFILMYYPLKYFRKFVFVLIVTVCPNPVASLGVLLGLNILFIGYMGVLRPREMPYMIFDFIIEGVMLAFELFMVVYMVLDTAKITAMSITTHAFGFITANLSIIVAIVLNIVAYYKIFMCIYQLYQHLKERVEEKEKMEAKQKDEIASDNINPNINEFLKNDDFILDEKQLDKKHRNDDSLTEEEARIDDLGKEERNIANLLSDKDLVMNNIQPRYDGDIQEGDPNFRGLFDDKQLYGDQGRNKDGGEFKVYEDELPTMKNKPGKNDENKKDKKGRNKEQKNTNVSGKAQAGLNDTNSYMLKRKEEEYLEYEEGEILENNRSSQRLQDIRAKNKLFSVNEPQSQVIQLRQKSRTLDNRNADLQKQPRNQTLLRDNKINNIHTYDSEEEDRPKDSDSVGRLNNQLNPLVFTESPDRLINQKVSGKQRADAKIVDKTGRNKVKPTEDMFDEFAKEDKAVFDERHNQRSKSKLNNEQFLKKIGYTEKLTSKGQEQLDNDGMQRDNGKIDDLNHRAVTIGLNSKIQKQINFENGKFDDGGNIKTYDRKKNSEKHRDDVLENDMKQLTLKHREAGTKHSNQLEPIKALRTKQKLKQDIFDEQQIEERSGVEKVQRREIDRLNNQMEEGLLVSRKPFRQHDIQSRKDQNKLNNLETFTRESKKKQALNEYVQQQQIPSGNLDQRRQNKKSSNAASRNDYQPAQNTQVQNAEYVSRQKVSNRKNEKDEQIMKGVLIDREKKERSKNNLQSENYLHQPYEIGTVQRQNNKSLHKDNVQQVKEQEGFFSKLFGLSKNQPRTQIQQSDTFNKPSISATSRLRKENRDDFQENNYSARINKEASNKNLAHKNKELIQKIKDHQDFGEDYQEVKRKNKDSIFKGKMNYGNINLDESDEKFDQSGYSRPLKEGGSMAKRDNGMSLDNRSDVSDGQEFGQGSRLMRAKNKQQTRSRSKLLVKDSSVDFADSDASSRLKQEQRDSVIKRGGKGRLNIDRIGDQEEGLENIQL